MAKKLSEQEFMEKAITTQPKNIDLSKVKFINTRTKVELSCKTCKESWSILAKVLTTKPLTCPYCNGRENNINSAYSNQPMILYFIRIKDESGDLYKVGITKHSVKQRFSLSDIRKIDIQAEIRYEEGKDAYAMEQYLHKKYHKFKYYGKPVLESHGNTELFTKDIYREIIGGDV